MFKEARLLLCTGLFSWAIVGFATAQETVDSVLAELKTVQENERASVEELREAVAKVQRIVDEFPSSDAAVSILLGEAYDGIVFKSFEERFLLASSNGTTERQPQSTASSKLLCLEDNLPEKSNISMSVIFFTDRNGDLSGLPEITKPENPGSDVRLEYLKMVAALEGCAPFDNSGDGTSYEVSMTDDGTISLEVITPSLEKSDNLEEAASVESAVTLPLGSEEAENRLGLSKQAIRDIQARLLVIDHDPSGVDGLIGNGTRSAIREWQGAVGAQPTGYINAEQLAALKEQSQNALDQWLRLDRNAELYDPPPPPAVLALSPRNLSGNWSYTTNCGSGSRLGKVKITGTLSIQHAGGGNYNGTLSNSQGFRGRVNATLSGRSVSAVTNFGLLIGRVSLKARVDDHKLVLRGRDSNGCSFYAAK